MNIRDHVVANRDIPRSECNWLPRDIKKGDEFKLGKLGGAISEGGVGVVFRNRNDDCSYEVPADAVSRVDQLDINFEFHYDTYAQQWTCYQGGIDIDVPTGWGDTPSEAMEHWLDEQSDELDRGNYGTLK